MSTYEKFFIQSADPRVLEWPLMRDPFLVFLLCAVYLFVIYYVLPKHMENRKAYNLKTIIQAYNIFQIVMNFYIMQGILTSGWTTTYSFGCEPIDFSTNEEPMRMLKYIYILFFLKLADFTETAFFVLRHKRNQVSFLHVYHHVSVVLTAWGVVKYIGGGMTSFSLMLNCFVHVLMYSYYFLTALGEDIRKSLNFIKPKLTMVQMVQFTIILIHGVQMLSPNCDIPNLAGYLFLPNVVIIYCLFINFYVQQYLKRPKKL